MGSIARVTLVGYISEPKVKTVGSDNVLSFSLAVNTGTKENQITDWYTVDKWRPTEPLIKALAKGTLVLVYGDLKIAQKDGKIYRNVKSQVIDIIRYPDAVEVTPTPVKQPSGDYLDF